MAQTKTSVKGSGRPASTRRRSDNEERVQGSSPESYNADWQAQEDEGGRVSQAVDRARDQARQARIGFWRQMDENPLGVGIAAIALGVLAGLAIPSTRREDELLGETRDRLLDDAKEAGREALDKGKQVASTTVKTLKDEVRTQVQDL